MALIGLLATRKATENLRVTRTAGVVKCMVRKNTSDLGITISPRARHIQLYYNRVTQNILINITCL